LNITKCSLKQYTSDDFHDWLRVLLGNMVSGVENKKAQLFIGGLSLKYLAIGFSS
jgi:hypothetical protein